ncbi:MAG: hypothetical protein HY000_20185 [Planctomycetes bacterium]|nr:hypothetical protein [Planctomycetota bacterium]
MRTLQPDPHEIRDRAAGEKEGFVTGHPLQLGASPDKLLTVGRFILQGQAGRVDGAVPDALDQLLQFHASQKSDIFPGAQEVRPRLVKFPRADSRLRLPMPFLDGGTQPPGVDFSKSRNPLQLLCKLKQALVALPWTRGEGTSNDTMDGFPVFFRQVSERDGIGNNT